VIGNTRVVESLSPMVNSSFAKFAAIRNVLTLGDNLDDASRATFLHRPRLKTN
jgi:hypothetical protein